MWWSRPSPPNQLRGVAVSAGVHSLQSLHFLKCDPPQIWHMAVYSLFYGSLLVSLGVRRVSNLEGKHLEGKQLNGKQHMRDNRALSIRRAGQALRPMPASSTAVIRRPSTSGAPSLPQVNDRSARACTHAPRGLHHFGQRNPLLKWLGA